MEKLKIGYDTLREINPKIIHSSTSGIYSSIIISKGISPHRVTNVSKVTGPQVHSHTEQATT